MLTKKDTANLVQELSNVFATKQELHELRTELRGDILDFKDVILGEIQSLRQEIQITIGYRGAIEDHEQRIQSLENHK